MMLRYTHAQIQCKRTGRLKAEQVKVSQQVIMYCQKLQVQLRQSQSA